MNDLYKHYMPPAAARQALRREAQSDNPSLEGDALTEEVERRYKIYLDKWVSYFRTRRP